MCVLYIRYNGTEEGNSQLPKHWVTKVVARGFHETLQCSSEVHMISGVLAQPMLCVKVLNGAGVGLSLGIY